MKLYTDLMCMFPPTEAKLLMTNHVVFFQRKKSNEMCTPCRCSSLAATSTRVPAFCFLGPPSWAELCLLSRLEHDSLQ